MRLPITEIRRLIDAALRRHASQNPIDHAAGSVHLQHLGADVVLGGTGAVATDPIWDAKGDLAAGTGANTAARLPVGTNTHILTADSAEATGLKWAAPAAAGAHNLLDGATHPDTLAGTVAEDDIIVGNATPKWSRLAVAAQTLVGRITGGHVVGLTAAQVKTLLGAGAASGLATLDGSTKVVENPANATATPTASKIPIADGSGKLAAGWLQEVLAYADLTDDPCVLKSLFDAYSILMATTDNTPVALTVAEQRLIGRITGGAIAALTPAQIMALLSGGATAAFALNSQKITGLAAATATGDAMRFDETPKLAGQLGGTVASPTVIGITSAGPMALTLGTIADGEYLKRVGATIVSGVPAGGGGATVALDNLASVAINASLVPAADSAIDLGSSAPKYFANAYVDKLLLNATATLDGATAGLVNLTGDQQMSGSLGLYGSTPDPSLALLIAPNVVGSFSGATINPATLWSADSEGLYALSGSAIGTADAARTGLGVRGLYFFAQSWISAASATYANVLALDVYAAAACLTSGAQTVTKMAGLNVQTVPVYHGGSSTLSITEYMGLNIDNPATNHIVTAYGIKVAGPTLATTQNYGLYVSGATGAAKTVVNVLQPFTLIGAAAVPALSAVLELQSTTGALLVSRMTTTQKAALTAVNGMIVYDLTLNKFQGYENGAWTSFI